MGADLYIDSEYEKNHAKWEPEFLHWVEIRDGLRAAGKTKEAARAQKKVEKYFDRMLSKGYFRDSYNDTNLLHNFGLSWWTDTEDLIDGAGKITPEKAEVFLRVLSDNEADFRAKMKTDPHRRYFSGEYKRLKAFLRRAITKNESIRASV